MVCMVAIFAWSGVASAQVSEPPGMMRVCSPPQPDGAERRCTDVDLTPCLNASDPVRCSDGLVESAFRDVSTFVRTPNEPSNMFGWTVRIVTALFFAGLARHVLNRNDRNHAKNFAAEEAGLRSLGFQASDRSLNPALKIPGAAKRIMTSERHANIWLFERVERRYAVNDCHPVRTAVIEVPNLVPTGSLRLTRRAKKLWKKSDGSVAADSLLTELARLTDPIRRRLEVSCREHFIIVEGTVASLPPGRKETPIAMAELALVAISIADRFSPFAPASQPFFPPPDARVPTELPRWEPPTTQPLQPWTPPKWE